MVIRDRKVVMVNTAAADLTSAIQWEAPVGLDHTSVNRSSYPPGMHLVAGLSSDKATVVVAGGDVPEDGTKFRWFQDAGLYSASGRCR